MGIPKRAFTGTATCRLIFIPVLFLCSCLYRKSIPEWITGEWASSFNGIAIRETWVAKSDHLTGTTVWSWKKNRRVDRLKMFYDKKDRLIYQIREPKRTTNYVCENPNSDTLVFVNYNANFPKRLIYLRPTGSSMKVWIDNKPNDPNQIVFPFKKVR